VVVVVVVVVLLLLVLLWLLLWEAESKLLSVFIRLCLLFYLASFPVARALLATACAINVSLQANGLVDLAAFARRLGVRVSAARERAKKMEGAGTRPGGGGVVAPPR